MQQDEPQVHHFLSHTGTGCSNLACTQPTRTPTILILKPDKETMTVITFHPFVVYLYFSSFDNQLTAFDNRH
jgi:hypothetical protein